MIDQPLVQRVRTEMLLDDEDRDAVSLLRTFKPATCGLSFSVAVIEDDAQLLLNLSYARYSAEELATPEAFARAPVLVWEWYLWRRELCREAVPNAGHRALVEMGRRVPRFTLVTQNVDGLHRRAGSTEPLELHGCLLQARRLDDDVVVPLPDVPGQVPPRCARTGGARRSDPVARRLKRRQYFADEAPPLGFELRCEGGIRLMAIDLLADVDATRRQHPLQHELAIAQHPQFLRERQGELRDGVGAQLRIVRREIQRQFHAHGLRP